MDDFEQHLADLHEIYCAKVGNHSVDLLSGVADTSIPVDFAGRYQLGKDLISEVTKIWVRYGKKSNVLVDAKLLRLFEILKNFEIELQILFVRSLLDQGIDLSKFDYFNLLKDEFNDFLI